MIEVEVKRQAGLASEHGRTEPDRASTTTKTNNYRGNDMPGRAKDDKDRAGVV